jgi:3,4-dihydroxy 2-butanone 4-phosphate synthase/GTP cyclohydrolase II
MFTGIYSILVNYHQIKDSTDNTYILSDINLAIDQFKKGGFVLVLDDENRENEGDLVVAASKITETQMTELINQTTGIICVPLERSRAKKLNLPLMCQENTDTHKTAFTVSVDYIETGTGVSSKDRLKTVRALANEDLIPSDLKRPGHIYPLIANDLGLTERKGHTEAAIALCKLAEIYPRVAVIGELQSKDGTMKKRQACYQYACENNIPMITIEQLLTAMEKLEDPKLLTDCHIVTNIKDTTWKMMCFGNHNKPHKVFVFNANANANSKVSNDIMPVRIHSECFTGDVFKSKHCDCGEQLDLAMKYIIANGEGIIIFPSDHEGRGIGIVNKVKAYKIQQVEGLNTFEANKELNLDIDARTYDDIKKILLQLNIKRVELLTDNPIKIAALHDLVVKVTPLIANKNEYNIKYLETKTEYFTSINTNKQFLIKDHNPIIDLTNIDTKSLKVALVYSNWHLFYIIQIINRLKEYLTNLGVTQISEFDVPGSNEIPFKASKIAKDFDGIICIGILIKGDTLHFENISTAVSNGIMQAQINTGVPMMNSVLSCLNMEQVIDRITGDKSTLEYIARALVKMTNQV